MGNTELTTKKCIACDQEFPVAEFYRLASSPDGFHRYCKSCCKMHRATERVQKRDKKSKISNRQKYRAQVEHGHEHVDEDITLAGVYKRDKGICAICKKKVESQWASIDHIKPLALGGLHVWSNVQLTHVKCNKQKGIKDHKELLKRYGIK